MRRPTIIAAFAVVAVGVSLIGIGRRADDVARGPIAVANEGYAVPMVTTGGGFPVILAVEAPEILLPDEIFPDGPSSMLWFQGRATNPFGDQRISVDGAGGVVKFGADLRPRMIAFEVDGRELVSVAALADGTFWLVASTGEFIRTNPAGEIQTLTRSPFDYAHVTSDPDGNVWAVRSPIRFSMRWERPGSPALVKIGEDGSAVDSIGTVVVPPDFMLTQLASSGYVAMTEDAIYYGPFIRDEVIALSYEGDTL